MKKYHVELKDGSHHGATAESLKCEFNPLGLSVYDGESNELVAWFAMDEVKAFFLVDEDEE